MNNLSLTTFYHNNIFFMILRWLDICLSMSKKSAKVNTCNYFWTLMIWSCVYTCLRDLGSNKKILCPCSELRVDLHDVTVCMQHKSFNKWITLQKADKSNNYQSECLLGMFEVHYASLWLNLDAKKFANFATSTASRWLLGWSL
mgnify:CR=1 FL=1